MGPGPWTRRRTLTKMGEFQGEQGFRVGPASVSAELLATWKARGVLKAAGLAWKLLSRSVQFVQKL